MQRSQASEIIFKSIFAITGTELNVQPFKHEIYRKIEELPPSAKLVFKVLEYGGLLTQKEIVRESYLPQRTVRYALSRLKIEGFLEERFYFKDARQSLYGLNSANFENIPVGQLYVLLH